MKAQSASYKISHVALYVVLIALAVLMLIPFAWMLSASPKLNKDVFLFPIRWIPGNPRWANYVDIWMRIPLVEFVLNTMKPTITVTILRLFISSFATYAFVKLKFEHRDLLLLAYVSTIAMPWQVYMVPQFIMMKSMEMNDSHMTVTCLQAFSAFGVFMMRQSHQEIPDELCEVARIDGMNEYRIWYKIMPPLSKLAPLTLIIFTSASIWNDFLGSMVYLRTETKETLQTGLRMFISQYSFEYGLIMAASIPSLIPVLVVFLSPQRYFVEGIAATDVKR